MSNNDVLRTLRYTFHYHDHKMKEIFGLGGKEISFEEVALWLKKEEDPDFKKLFDKDLCHFLDGLIVLNRGKREGAAPVLEKSLNNNGILRKLKIALNLQEEGMLEIFGLRGFRLSKHELSAFFRNPSQAQYRECKDQVMRNFLMGLQEKYRGQNSWISWIFSRGFELKVTFHLIIQINQGKRIQILSDLKKGFNKIQYLKVVEIKF